MATASSGKIADAWNRAPWNLRQSRQWQMPTRYGAPVATMRTSPHRQPPVVRSISLLLWNQAGRMFTTHGVVGAISRGRASTEGARHDDPARTAHPRSRRCPDGGAHRGRSGKARVAPVARLPRVIAVVPQPDETAGAIVLHPRAGPARLRRFGTDRPAFVFALRRPHRRLAVEARYRLVPPVP